MKYKKLYTCVSFSEEAIHGNILCELHFKKDKYSESCDQEWFNTEKEAIEDANKRNKWTNYILLTKIVFDNSEDLDTHF